MPTDPRLLFEGLSLFISIAEAKDSGFLERTWERAKRIGKEFERGAKKIGGEISKHKKPIGITAGVVSAAALIAGGIYAYNRFLSKAAKKCVGYSGSEKSECMSRVRSGATDAEISELKKSMSLCAMSSDPMTCRKRLKDRLEKVTEQLYQLRSNSLLKD